MKSELNSIGQYSLVDNVEYKIINTRKFLSLIQQNGAIISAEAQVKLDLEQIKSEVLEQGFSTTQIESLVSLCQKQIFTENKFGKSILKLARHFIKEPITQDGEVKQGLWNKLAAYGLQIPGVTGGYGLERHIKNLVTNAGFAGVASRINGSGAEAAFTYIAVGTGTTAANASDTTLQTETAASGLSRAAATASRVTTTQTNDTAQLVLTFTVTGTVAVTESGVLNASSVGVLLCRQVFSAINVVNGDSLQITWKVKAA